MTRRPDCIRHICAGPDCEGCRDFTKGEPMTLDLSKKVTTRDGRAVRDLHVLGGPLSTGETIIGVILAHGTISASWMPDGRWRNKSMERKDDNRDLINPPPEPERIKGTVWIAVSRSKGGAVHTATFQHKKDAINHVRQFECFTTIVEVPIDCAVGEGLDDEGR